MRVCATADFLRREVGLSPLELRLVVLRCVSPCRLCSCVCVCVCLCVCVCVCVYVSKGVQTRGVCMDREPGCLQLSLTRKLMPTCAYLMEDLNLSQQQLRTLVSKVSVSPICVCVCVW